MFTELRWKYKSLSIQAKSTIWFALCNILQKGISFITVPIFTRLLSTEEYGIYSIYLSWLQILTIITSLYLYYGVLNNGMTKYDKDRDVYVSSMQGLTLTITLFIFVLFIINRNYWSTLFGLTPLLMYLMFTEMAVSPALGFWSGRQRFESKYKALVIVTLSKSLFNPLLGLILVMVSRDKSTARVLSVVVTEVIFCGTIMIYQFVKGRIFFHLDYWKYAITLAIPLIPHYLSGMILNQGDRIMIDRMVGKTEVAYYSVAYSMGMVVQVVTTALTNSITPWIYKKMKASEYAGVKKTISISATIVFAVSIIIMMFSPELVLLFGESYRSAVYVIPPVAASTFFIYLYNILAIPQFYFEKTEFSSFASIIAAVINVILNFIFIGLFGYVAAAYTTLLCYILYSLGHFSVSNLVIKQIAPDFLFIDEYYILALSTLIILAGVSSNFLFGYRIIRLFLLVLILMSILMFRKKILKTLSNMNN